MKSPAELSVNPSRVHILAVAVLALTIFTLTNISAHAMNIKEVTSPSGIKAWLVEEHSVPVVSMRFAFRGGASQDPADKEGVAYFVSGMLDEGAGDLSSTEFQQKVEEVSVKINFDASRDVFAGGFRTISDRLDKSSELLRLALTKPRFDQDALERIRRQIITGLKFDLNDPNKIAAREWFKLAFEAHPYSRSVKGYEQSLSKITRDDLVSFVNNNFARDNLTVAVVGDISEERLGKLLDDVFGQLPKKSTLNKVAEAAPPKGPVTKVIEMDVPQSVAQFGRIGLKRDDKDFIPAYILNYIIGGGGFSSKLMEEVREKRGLAYSVYSYLSPYRRGSAYIGGVATENKSIGKSLQVIREVFEDIAKNGPTADELENAKQYLTGSYALRFDTSSKIASQLLWIQIENLGVKYIDERNANIEKVTLEDIKRVAAQLLKSDDLIITIVGKPTDLPKKSKNTPG